MHLFEYIIHICNFLYKIFSMTDYCILIYVLIYLIFVDIKNAFKIVHIFLQ